MQFFWNECAVLLSRTGFRPHGQWELRTSPRCISARLLIHLLAQGRTAPHKAVFCVLESQDFWK